MTAPFPAVRDAESAAYWDGVAEEWTQRGEPIAWRALSDAVNLGLVERWLTGLPARTLLKTDLFDEFAGEGLLGALSLSFASVRGIDISPAVVQRVRERNPRADVGVADIRCLPYDDGAFDAVVSISTLDHFATLEAVALALSEIHRVVARRGALVITLDNGMNPIVAARNALPPRWRDWTRLVPYSVGATCRRPADLRALLQRAGFEVTKLAAVLHSPRVAAVPIGRFVDRHCGDRALDAYSRWLLAFERLGRLPSRYVTGHFLAALAIKP